MISSGHVGECLHSGRGLNDILMYRGVNGIQSGRNVYVISGGSLGNFFRRFYSFVAPIVEKSLPSVKSGLKAASRELLEGGIEVLKNINTDTPINKLVKNEASKRAKNISEKALNQLHKNLTMGEGIKRLKKRGGKKKKSKKVARRKNTIKNNESNISSIIKGLVVKKKRITKNKNSKKRVKKGKKTKINTKNASEFTKIFN